MPPRRSWPPTTYPLTGFFTLWMGYGTARPVCWLPWLLLLVFLTCRQRNPLAPIGVALVTWLTVSSGNPDVAAQVLITSGFCALWWLRRAVNEGRRKGNWRPLLRVLASLSLAWGLGLALASGLLLQALDYGGRGARIEARAAGSLERPPAGADALPQLLLPDLYGRSGFYRLTFDNQLESSAAGYAGAVAALLLAPVAALSRRHRPHSLLLTGLAFFGLIWCLGLYPFLLFFKLPVMNLMSHNRLVFLTAFALIALAAIGFDVLCRRAFFWHRRLGLPILLLGLLAGWSGYRALVLPREINQDAMVRLAEGRNTGWARTAEDLARLQAGFRKDYVIGGAWCVLALGCWALLRSNRRPQGLIGVVSGSLLLLELFTFGKSRVVQSSPSLYFPEIPALTALRHSPDRVLGVDCLPANLASAAGLRDPRGYDGIDPKRWTELLQLGADPGYPKPPYAAVQWFKPTFRFSPDGTVAVPPVLDMLAVRHLIFRGLPDPKAKVVAQSPDYWVAENPNALPRVFVPTAVECVVDSEERLRALSQPTFDARLRAYVEEPLSLPSQITGSALIDSETPTQITIRAEMMTQGLIVLADRWDPGWLAYVDGKSAPIHITNHALRGVVAPPGQHTLEFRFEPPILGPATLISLAAFGLLVLWLLYLVLTNPRPRARVL